MARDLAWEADLARYPNRPFLKEQSIWAIWVYRFGRRVDLRTPGPIKVILTKWYWLMFRLVETILAISIPKEADIGAGLKIWHFGGIFVHPGARLGASCTLRQGVTIGNRRAGGRVPVVGNNVDFGAYAQVLGSVQIGDNCFIGAMSVVLSDVPPDTTAVGAPARIVDSKQRDANGASDFQGCEE